MVLDVTCRGDVWFLFVCLLEHVTGSFFFHVRFAIKLAEMMCSILLSVGTIGTDCVNLIRLLWCVLQEFLVVTKWFLMLLVGLAPRPSLYWGSCHESLDCKYRWEHALSTFLCNITLHSWHLMLFVHVALSTPHSLSCWLQPPPAALKGGPIVERLVGGRKSYLCIRWCKSFECYAIV